MNDLDEMNLGELIAFKGTTHLATRCCFLSWRQLWSMNLHSDCLDPFAFGSFCQFSRDRHESIFKNHCWGFQPPRQLLEMSSEECSWILIEPFVFDLNEHKEKNFHPSSHMCGDELFFCWCGIGGDWTNLGPPMCVACERKPENGCKIQSTCCDDFGVICHLKVHESARAMTVATAKSSAWNGAALWSLLNSRTKDTLHLVLSWTKTGRVVVADLHFASVQCACKLCKVGPCFIGHVKTATQKFQMVHLNGVQLPGGGSHCGATLLDLLAFTWCDRERRTIVSSCGNLWPAAPIIHWQFCHAQRCTMTIVAGLINTIKRCKMISSLKGRLAHVIGQNEWITQLKEWKLSMHSSLTLAAHSHTLTHKVMKRLTSSCTSWLMKWLSGNKNINLICFTKKKCNCPMNVVHLAPTKCMRPSSSFASSGLSGGAALLPLTCKNVGCVHRSAWVCTACNKETHLCHQRWGRTCFQQHCDTVHPGKQCCLSASCDGQFVSQMLTFFHMLTSKSQFTVSFAMIGMRMGSLAVSHNTHFGDVLLTWTDTGKWFSWCKQTQWGLKHSMWHWTLIESFVSEHSISFVETIMQPTDVVLRQVGGYSQCSICVDACASALNNVSFFVIKNEIDWEKKCHCEKWMSQARDCELGQNIDNVCLGNGHCTTILLLIKAFCIFGFLFEKMCCLLLSVVSPHRCGMELLELTNQVRWQ